MYNLHYFGEKLQVILLLEALFVSLRKTVYCYPKREDKKSSLLTATISSTASCHL